MRSVTGSADRSDRQALLEQALAMNTHGVVLEDPILMDLMSLRDLRALLVALAAQHRDIHHGDRGSLVGRWSDVVATVTVAAERCQLVAPRRRLTVQAALLLGYLATVTAGAVGCLFGDEADVVLAMAVTAVGGPLAVGGPKSAMATALHFGDRTVVAHTAVHRLHFVFMESVSHEVGMAVDTGHVAMDRGTVGRLVYENRDLFTITAACQVGVRMASQAVLGLLGYCRSQPGDQSQAYRQEEDAVNESGASWARHGGSPAEWFSGLVPGERDAVTSSSSRLPPLGTVCKQKHGGRRPWLPQPEG